MLYSWQTQRSSAAKISTENSHPSDPHISVQFHLLLISRLNDLSFLSLLSEITDNWRAIFYEDTKDWGLKVSKVPSWFNSLCWMPPDFDVTGILLLLKQLVQCQESWLDTFLLLRKYLLTPNHHHPLCLWEKD